jgi:hypothetical protein
LTWWDRARDSVADTHGSDSVVDELRGYARAIGPRPAAVRRLRAGAQDAYRASVATASFAPSAKVIQLGFLVRRMPLILMTLTVLAATFGDISACTGLSVFGFGTLALRAPGMLGAPFTAIAVLVIVGGVLELALAFGFWSRRSWAWPLGVVVEAMMLILALCWILVGAQVALQIVRALVSLVILTALDHRDVRAALESPAEGRRLLREPALS